MTRQKVRAVGRRTVILILVGVTTFWSASCRNRNETGIKAPVPIALTALDGLRIDAMLYPANHPNAPGLILIHGLGASAKTWQSFARRAQQLGYGCIAFDLRGHGKSTDRGGQRISYKTFSEADWNGAARDIGSVWAVLPDHGINPSNCALVGSSIGANLALVYAAEHTEVPAVVLISPGIDYKGIKTESAIVTLGQRPVLLISGKDDTYSAATCETLKRTATGFSEIRLYAGSAHGVDLLDGQNAVQEDIFLWLRPIIGQNLPLLD